MKAKCTAIVEGDRIHLVIRKTHKGYKDFFGVLEKIDNSGLLSWYGDIENEEGKEQSGLVITNK